MTALDVRRELALNAGRPRIQVGILLLRLAQGSRRRLGRRNPLSLALGLLYRWYALGGLGIDIPISTQIGSGLQIFHGFGIVINAHAVLGTGVVLRHGVTIGNRGDGESTIAPRIGDGVVFGAQASVLGGVHVGTNAVVGAHALVMADVLPEARIPGGAVLRGPQGSGPGGSREG